MVTAARILALAVAVCCGACSQAGGPAVEAAPATQTHGVMIAQIVTHDSKVAIVGGGDLRVIVRRKDGTMVADGISVAELRARDPELHAVVTSSFASKDGYVDATLDLGHLN